MKVLGISPLDKDATAVLVEDGRVLFAAAEERFNRVKHSSGFPLQAIRAALTATGTDVSEIELVAYPFLSWKRETELIGNCMAAECEFQATFVEADLQHALNLAAARIVPRSQPIHGLASPNEKMEKGWLKNAFYRLAGATPAVSRHVAARASRLWAAKAIDRQRHWQIELERGLAGLGLGHKLKRADHHLSHAANAYLASGYQDALIVTLDGYGSGLAGSVNVGSNGRLKRLHELRFPHSLGSFYEAVTSSLGFKPDRHAGKIVGLAAYGDPLLLADVLLGRFEQKEGDFRILENLNVHFSRHLAARFPKADLAAAWQHVLEVVAVNLVKHWMVKTGSRNLVLSGGVSANVKLNQRLHAIAEVERIFIYPNMGDGGCGTGLALLWSTRGDVLPSYRDVYFGPAYTPAEIKAELDRAGLAYTMPAEMSAEVARRLFAGEVIARFDGRMEYGPRALGNRSILYHTREPAVNQWLNQRLGRTEFMPFAPVTLWEARDLCYVGVDGAEQAAEFMTITFDCTDWMKRNCPAAVHIDGTARPQLIRRETNPQYYDIVKAYEKLSGLPCLINTSFNMHEEPIVCSPGDAVRAFLLGRLDGLAIGPFFVPRPSK